MTRTAFQFAAVLLVCAPLAAQDRRASSNASPASSARPAANRSVSAAPEVAPVAFARDLLNDDLGALQARRPGFGFWQHVFTTPDGAIAFGSALDGRLLAVFPAAGDWHRSGRWSDPALARVLSGEPLPSGLGDRRDRVAAILEREVGPVVHNPTRGGFVLPNVPLYGGFLQEWGAIYERFGVPAGVGLAQALVESGFSGTVRSEARAVGFCQWLTGNWKVIQRLASHPIESTNQTTQAQYCAAYLAVLMTKYGSLIPALSEHHAGGTNVGRALINGARLGGQGARDQYLLGAELVRDLRLLAPGGYRDLYGTYGPRSFAYAEMVFGNIATIDRLKSETPQRRIFAMRSRRALPLAEVARVSKVSTSEIRRFNPALVRQVPAGADLYLPAAVPALGADVSFWRRPAPAAFTAALGDFLRLEVPVERWDTPAIMPMLETYQRRFRASRSEEGQVMAVVLGYMMADIRTSGRGAILADFRTNPSIETLFGEAVLARQPAQPVAAVAGHTP